ncbi:hypothetical protein P154DRAFT_615493 [Amniculicola lignicola CBS 123094]|uniref:Uncharacterized protein n=1 Tax=Amniculicola lignicola CBS 123094 TaxID=1392246 RepID=A0A6A5WYP7_9PLEO|nr:hypothetical protein P154DRAFT_615493 [Amniculicola lignicola CBS 123094]
MDCSNYFLDTSHIVPFLGMEQPHRFVSSLDARTSPAQHGLDLLSIAKQYSTEELADVWRSSRLDIVEQHTHNVLLRSVPKRMLCLFLGNERYYSLLRTVDEHGRLYPKVKDRYAATQNSVWPRQLLVIPHGTTHHIGWKILVAWMDRACSEQTLFKIHAIKTPEEHFPAACLARTFRFLDFHADAHRVESAILRRLNQHPMPLADMKSVYNCFPDEDLFMYQLVEHLARRIYGYQRGDDAALANVFWVERFVCENPKLKEWVQHALFLVEKEWESRPSSKTCQNYQLRGGGGVDNAMTSQFNDWSLRELLGITAPQE